MGDGRCGGEGVAPQRVTRLRCTCHTPVYVASFDDGVPRMIEVLPSPKGTVVELESGEFHIMRGPNYPSQATRWLLHTCKGGR